MLFGTTQLASPVQDETPTRSRLIGHVHVYRAKSGSSLCVHTHNYILLLTTPPSPTPPRHLFLSFVPLLLLLFHFGLIVRLHVAARGVLAQENGEPRLREARLSTKESSRREYRRCATPLPDIRSSCAHCLPKNSSGAKPTEWLLKHAHPHLNRRPATSRITPPLTTQPLFDSPNISFSKPIR